MSLSRSPSPIPGGGWSSPGLNMHGGRSSPAPHVTGGPAAWDSAKTRNHNVNGYPSFSTQNSGYFVRHMRRLSSSLPRFYSDTPPHALKEKRRPGRWTAAQNVPLVGRIRSIFGRMGRKFKMRLLIAAVVLFCLLLFFNTRRSTFDARRLLRYANMWILSPVLPLETSIMGWRWREVRNDPRRQRGRWSDGVEGSARMGHRARQHTK
jgi:hypothetical protein